MKKWKQLVVFVMILTMMMGMTSFAAGDSGITSGASSAGVADATDPSDSNGNDTTDDTTGGTTGGDDSTDTSGSDVIGAVVDTYAPEAELASTTAVVGGKEVEVELVVKTLDEAISGSELVKIKDELKAQAAALTGFRESSNNRTILFDIDLLIKGGGTVGTSLEETVAVSINCGSNIPAGATKDNLRVLHYSDSKQAWEKRRIVSYADGVVTAEFDSFSPVAVVYSDIPVVDEDSRLTNKTNDGWGLTAVVPTNKYNVINLSWNPQGSTKVKYELGIFNSPEDANPLRIVSTKKTSYKFSKAECGKAYYFRVRVQGGSWSDVCYNATSLAGVPTKLTTKSTYNTITLSWAKVRGAKSYDIYVYGPEGSTVISNVKSSKYTFKNVTTGVRYTYEVVAKREHFVSETSEAVTGMAELSALTSVKVKGLDSASVKVTWKRVKGASYYIVQRWNGEEWETLTDEKAPLTANFFVDNGTKYTSGSEEYYSRLQPGRNYRYRVTAVRDNNSVSNEGQGTTKNLAK